MSALEFILVASHLFRAVSPSSGLRSGIGVNLLVDNIYVYVHVYHNILYICMFIWLARFGEDPGR